MSGFFADIFHGGDTDKRSTGYEVVVESMNANRNAAAGIVTPTTAMKLSAVYACVRILAETMGSLPLILYERVEDGKQRAADHYLYKLLHDRPNPLMTAFEFRETIQAHLALWGNAYVQLEYDARGRVTELWPLLPNMVHMTKREGTRILYYYQLPNGQMIWLSNDKIWHLRGLGGDGLNGYSVVGFARMDFETSDMANQYVNRFYKNDARPGIVLEHPGELSDEAHKRLRGSWKETHEGVEKSHRVAILEEGLKLHEVGIPPQDAQFIETRSFQINDIARWFRMQPHKIGQMENATFSNIEHQSIEHVTDTIQPWARRWEASIDQNLLLPQERQRYYAEFLLEALLRGDTAARYTAYSQARQWGWMSANDIRRLENMNPVKGGDIYLVPLNMVPAPTAGQPADQGRSSRAKSKLPATRESRAATMRLRLRGSYLGIYRDTAKRILRRESNDIKQYMAKRWFRGLVEDQARAMDPTQFVLWLEQYYQDQAGKIIRDIAPINAAYGEAVVAEALDEIGEEQQEELSPEVVRFIDSYTGGYAARHIGISRARLMEAIKNAQQEEMAADEAIEQELDRWESSRSDWIAEEESTRFNNAVAKTVFALAGVKKLKSVAFGDSCPYCKSLDGKVVGINKFFLTVGEQLLPDGVDVPLTTTSNIGHPPYHGGCDCMIISEI
jgi:HK97 family phage portal protein